MLAGADTFVEMEAWFRKKLEWFRRDLKPEHGISSHDTFGRPFELIDPDEFAPAFQPSISSVLPAVEPQEVAAIDGKASRRTGKVGSCDCPGWAWTCSGLKFRMRTLLELLSRVCPGEVPEWPNGPDSKSGVRASVPWVRIPPSPPIYFVRS